MSRQNILTNDTARQQFIEACLALKSEPISGTPYSIYDYFPHWHFQAMNFQTPAGQMRRNAAHGGPSFGPWHRLLLLMFEVFSRQVLDNPNFEAPYWDWAADADNPEASPLWNVLGGDGDPANGNVVTSGPFRMEQFEVRLTDSLTPGQWMQLNPPRALRRDFGWDGTTRLASQIDVGTSVDTSGFYDRWPYDNRAASFRRDLEIPLHNSVHRFVGGDMMSSASPNDPVFFLHHCNIDRIWAAWQARYPTAAYVPGDEASADLLFHRIGDRMHNYFEVDLPISEMVDYAQYYDYDSLS